MPKPVRIKRRFVQKNFVTLFCAFVAPQFLLGLLFAVEIFSSTGREVCRRMENTLLLAEEDMERLAGNTRTVELYFQNSGMWLGMDRMMNGGTASYTDYRMLKQLSSVIQAMTNASLDLESVYLYVPNRRGQFYTSDGGLSDFSARKDTGWTEVLENSQEESFIMQREKRDYAFEQKRKVLSVFQKLKGGSGGIVFNYDLERLRQYYDTAMFYPEQVVVISDQKGSPVLKNSQCTEELASEISRAASEGKESVSLKKGKYRLLQKKFEKFDLNITTGVPERLFYSAGLEHMRTTAASLTLVLFLSVFLAWLITVKDYRRLSEVVRWFELAEAQKPLPRIPTKDMYSQILQNIIRMFLKNNYLEIRLSEEKYRKQAAELRALQYQINPHFLFNTLQTIRYAILDETGKENGCAERMVDNLADIMRYSLISGEEKVTLWEEKENCMKYIAIQQERYQNIFRVEWDIAQEARERRIPRLILQPLIENAVLHGIRKKKQGKIRVRARKTADGIRIAVADNGNGIKKERLEKLKEQLCAGETEYESSHIGLQNVNLRLRLEYGPQSVLHIRSREGAATEVWFWIPGED